jgi:hypothetical protein
MLRNISTAELCRGLGLSRARLDQLVSRGLIAPQHKPEPGKAREWTIIDALRVAVFIDLADTQGVTLDPVVSNNPGVLINLRDRLQPGRVGLFAEGRTFLVISRLTLSLVPASKRGEPAKPSIPTALTDELHPRIVSERNLPRELAEARHSAAIVIDLGAVEERLLAFWPKGDAQ